MKNKYVLFCMACLIMVGMCLPVIGYGAEEGMKPSLYHNDEAWYKDGIAPLLSKDGIYHIPADILEMFPGITVQVYPENNNLLIYDVENDNYVSVLYSTASAAVNGNIIRNIAVFRQQGYYYIGAEWIADIFGLECTFKEDTNGKMLLRLTNGEQRKGFNALINDYVTEKQPEETHSGSQEVTSPENDNIKRIYLVCTDAPDKQYTPAAMIEKNGLKYTEFLQYKSTPERIISNVMINTGGVFSKDGSLEAAEQVNEVVENLIWRKLPLVLLPYGSDTAGFTEAGYLPIVPDFTVNYQTDPDVIFADMLAYLRENDHVVLWIDSDGCSQRMLVLLCELLGWNEEYTTEKLTDWK